MASDWFDSVTGSNDYERQSWRDSYNGGRAAGDWTGNNNARLDREREAYGGATWSGSSSEYSALEWAQLGGGVGTGSQQNGQPVTTGPGVPGAQAPGATPGSGLVDVEGLGPQTPIRAPVGPGGPRRTATVLSQLTAGGTLTGQGRHGPLKPQMESTVQELLLGGWRINPNPRTSNAEEWEIRYAEPGEWVGGLVVMGADLGYNAAQLVGWDSQRSGADARAALNAAGSAIMGVAERAAQWRDRQNYDRIDSSGWNNYLDSRWRNEVGSTYPTPGATGSTRDHRRRVLMACKACARRRAKIAAFVRKFKPRKPKK